MRFAIVMILFIVLTGCAVSHQPGAMSEAQAVNCLRMALEREMEAGSSATYEPKVDLEGPYTDCWPSLSLEAKKIYAPLFVEAALEQGLASILAENCTLILTHHPNSGAAKKCRLLVKAGLTITESKGGKENARQNNGFLSD